MSRLGGLIRRVVRKPDEGAAAPARTPTGTPAREADARPPRRRGRRGGRGRNRNSEANRPSGGSATETPPSNRRQSGSGSDRSSEERTTNSTSTSTTNSTSTSTRRRGRRGGRSARREDGNGSPRDYQWGQKSGSDRSARQQQQERRDRAAQRSGRGRRRYSSDQLDAPLPEDIAFRAADEGGDRTILPARRRPPPGLRDTSRVIIGGARSLSGFVREAQPAATPHARPPARRSDAEEQDAEEREAETSAPRAEPTRDEDHEDAAVATPTTERHATEEDSTDEQHPRPRRRRGRRGGRGRRRAGSSGERATATDEPTAEAEADAPTDELASPGAEIEAPPQAQPASDTAERDEDDFDEDLDEDGPDDDDLDEEDPDEDELDELDQDDDLDDDDIDDDDIDDDIDDDDLDEDDLDELDLDDEDIDDSDYDDSDFDEDDPEARHGTSTERPAAAAVAAEAPAAFEDLGLRDRTLEALSSFGFVEPTPIQARSIPILLAGRDVVGLAQTGSGKTVAFGAPMVERIDANLAEVQAIVLVPTRELAQQVLDVIVQLAEPYRVSAVGLLGGRALQKDFTALDSRPQIVVGTPGRIIDHLRRGTLSLRSVGYAVLDEADQMLDIGFLPDIRRILGRTPKRRQTGLFSATMPTSIRRLIWQFMDDPETVRVDPELTAVESIEQIYYEVAQRDKTRGLRELVERELKGRTLVFCNTRRGVDRLADNLQHDGVQVGALHGDMDQRRRDRVVERFRKGELDVLIATNVAARGIDIPEITHVVNFDVPQNVEEYIHRTGRTGRAGRDGKAITFVAEWDLEGFDPLLQHFGDLLQKETLELYA